MFISQTRIAAVIGSAAIALSATLCEAQCTSCGAASGVVTYARPATAARIAWMPSYGVTSSCNPWVPGSCGYSVYRPVRACAYTPVISSACNSCTSCGSGCSSCASPVSTYAGYGAASPCSTCTTVLRTRQVPGQPIRNVLRILLPPYRPIAETVCSTPQVSYYPSTTYYSGYSSSCAPAACSSCAPAGCTSCAPASCSSCYAPACDTWSASGSGCSTCSSAATTTQTYQNEGAPSTYRQDSQSESQQRLMPTPETNTDPTTFGTPKRLAPESRTAMQPARQNAAYRTVAFAGATAPAAPAVDVSGWRASSD